MEYTTLEVFSKFPPTVLAQYDFSGASYTNAKAPITGVICHKHGIFQQYAAQFRKGGAGCPECGKEKRTHTLRMTPAEFIRRAEENNPGKYDYSNTHYVNMLTKVGVECKLHGEFSTRPARLAYKKQGISRGCPKCGRKQQARSRIASAKQAVVAKAHAVHGDVYGYDVATSTSGRQLLSITCPKHGVFSQLPYNHIGNKQGCPECWGERRVLPLRITPAEFLRRAEESHSGKYDYSGADYVNMTTKVDIICPKHGVFSQLPLNHLERKGGRADGCPRCGQKSSGETEVGDFLSIFSSVVRRDRVLLRPKEVDIYLPFNNLAIEYCGEYWHSAGDFTEVSAATHRHITKHKALADKGIRLITLYESEWKERQFAVRRLLRAAIGKLRGKLMARKCELKRVSHSDAVLFFGKYHVQGGRGYGEHYGLYWKGKLAACMRFAKGINDRGDALERDWTLARYATRISVVGGASRLFSAFVGEFKPTKIKSFSDNRFFPGGMYEKLGFVLADEAHPDYSVYHQRTGLLPKTAWQRRAIPARIKEVGSTEVFDPATDPRTERDMTFLLGGRQLYDCGKKRWIWTA